jgi:post-segregation antitoxin (ccd killing protein)
MSEHQITGIEIHPATVTEAAEAKEREQETSAMLQVEMNNENKKDGSSRWLSTGSIG